jgi:thiamine-phosphate diphosphorylase
VLTTRPLLCLVTDRKRLAEALQRPLADACELVLRQIEAAVAAEVALVQIRERDLEARELVRLVLDAVRIAATSSTRIVVNDRIDIAMVSDAAGVHLRESSIAATDVRRLAPSLLVGRSVHSQRSAADAGPVDYLIAGTCFPTAAKPGAPTLGMEGLRQVVEAAAARPVLAIGGIVPDAVASVVSAGAAGVAAIGAFIPSHPTDDIALVVQQGADALRLGFGRSVRGA